VLRRPCLLAARGVSQLERVVTGAEMAVSYPAAAMEVTSVELGQTAASKWTDDDGRPKRTGKDACSLQTGPATTAVRY
jgi:hypothetical protein